MKESHHQRKKPCLKGKKEATSMGALGEINMYRNIRSQERMKGESKSPLHGPLPMKII